MYIVVEEVSTGGLVKEHECKAKDLKLVFTNKDGDAHYAFMKCKLCGKHHPMFSEE